MKLRYKDSIKSSKKLEDLARDGKKRRTAVEDSAQAVGRQRETVYRHLHGHRGRSKQYSN